MGRADQDADCDGGWAAMTARDKGNGAGLVRRIPTRLRGYPTKVGGGGVELPRPKKAREAAFTAADAAKMLIEAIAVRLLSEWTKYISHGSGSASSPDYH